MPKRRLFFEILWGCVVSIEKSENTKQVADSRWLPYQTGKNKLNDEAFASLISEAEAIFANPDEVLEKYAPEMAIA